MMGIRVAATLIVTLTVLALPLTLSTAGEKSESKVKATATASKIADGKQTVTITLDIDKGWYIYANPINANSDIFAPNTTVVTFKAKDKLKADVKYPKGKQKVDGKYQFDIYENRVVVEAQVQRVAGDATLRCASALMSIRAARMSACCREQSC